MNLVLNILLYYSESKPLPGVSPDRKGWHHQLYNFFILLSGRMYHPSDNEQDLLRRISAGDEQAFRQLYDAHWPKVYAYLESLVKSAAIAEEMVADIFMKLWMGRNWLPNVENIGGFLRVAAKNKALDFLKVTSRQNKLISAYHADMVIAAPKGPDHHLLDSEVMKIWDEAVAQLSPRRREIFLLHRQEGLSYQEIAERMSVSPATVKKTMSAALASIREFLSVHYKDSLAALLLFLLL